MPKRCVDDPTLSATARQLLRAALAAYAKWYGLPDQTPEENLAAIIELYEAGMLQIESGGSGVVVGPSQDARDGVQHRNKV